MPELKKQISHPSPTKKTKVLFAINCMNIGGAPSVVFHQLKYLDTTRFDPYLLMLYPSKKANFLSQMDFLPQDRIIQFRLKNRSIFDIKTLANIFSFLREEKFDVVYTHLFLSNLLVRFLAIFARVPMILSFEHSEYRGKKLWQKVADKILSWWTDKILVSVPAVAEFTAQQEYISKEKFVVITNPVVLPDRERLDVEALRLPASCLSSCCGLRAGIPAGAKVALTIGRFSEEKGHERLLRAAEMVRERTQGIFFLIVGHGPLERKLQEFVRSYNMQEYVRVLTDPLHAKEYLYLADIFVLPSLREGQAIVVYEAMKAGVPVIASDLAGVRNILQDEKNGLLVPPGEPDVLAEEICRLVEDTALRQRLLQEGLSSVGHLSPDAASKMLGDLIESLYVLKNIAITSLSPAAISYQLPSIFFRKCWVWFANPENHPNCDLLTVFSYNDREAPGFRKKEGLTTVIDLSLPEETLWGNMRQKFVQKQIKRGERNGVRVHKDENFSEFKKLYNNFRKGKNLPHDSMKAFRDHGVLFSAYYKRQMVAAGIFVCNGEHVRAWSLASVRLGKLDGQMRDVVGQANRMVIWEAMKYFRSLGVRYFDLGGINPDSQKSEDISLAEFKEAFGGVRTNTYYYRKINSRLFRAWFTFRKKLHFLKA